MKRITTTTMILGLLSALCISGCLCPPTRQIGMNRSYISNPALCDTGCDPCGPVDPCGIIEYRGGQSFYGGGTRLRVPDCTDSIANLSNGAFLVKRGILDIAAAPFVFLGSALSSNCRYEVLSYCDDNRFTSSIINPCGPCDQVFDSCSGCDTCANGYTEGIRYGVRSPYQTSLVIPPAPLRGNTVVQASYEVPTAPAARFVQPR